MPRARNIKPAFFANEDLANLAPHARLLFIGLWTLADRAGRLENRQARIRAQVFPYEAVDIAPLLDSLERAGFIRCYAAGGARYILVENFTRHQHFHRDEAQSRIPAPVDATPNVAAPVKHGVDTVQAPCNNESRTGKELNGHAEPRMPPGEPHGDAPRAAPAERGDFESDSLNLVLESGEVPPLGDWVPPEDRAGLATVKATIAGLATNVSKGGKRGECTPEEYAAARGH